MADDDQDDLLPVEVGEALGKMLDEYPLPNGVSDEDMNQDRLAPSLNTTLPTLRRWMKEPGFPIVQEGGQGRSYVFRLSHCYAWMMHRAHQEQLTQSRQDRVQAQMQAHFLGIKPEDPTAKMTARQRREHADADFAHSRAAHQRRQLIRLEDVTDLLEYLLTVFRESNENLADRLERELGLTAAQVGIVRRAGRDVLQAVHDRIESEQLAEVEIVEENQQLMI